MAPRPPIHTRTDPLFPYTTLLRSADRLPFDFLPGQFLQVEVEPEAGKPGRRSYTIASSPTQRAYVELTVKREEQGAVSRHLHDSVSVGDLVKVTGPRSEEHTSEHQSLMRITYAVFCLKKQKT